MLLFIHDALRLLSQIHRNSRRSLQDAAAEIGKLQSLDGLRSNSLRRLEVPADEVTNTAHRRLISHELQEGFQQLFRTILLEASDHLRTDGILSRIRSFAEQ